MNEKPLQVLAINSSGRRDGSITRELTSDLVAALRDRHGTIQLTRRDVGSGLPFVDAAWFVANYTPDESRTLENFATLALSFELVQ
jgi:FMN-dependent NADH-azoreductase